MKKRVKKIGWYDETGDVRRAGLPEHHMAVFDRALDKLIAQFFLKDEDGDFPVRVSVLDRTENMSMGYAPMLQTIKHLNDPALYKQKVLENYRRAMLNVALSAGDARATQNEMLDLVRGIR